MADERTEKQKVQEITDKLEEGQSVFLPLPLTKSKRNGIKWTL